MADTAFRYMAASNDSMAWGKVNEQLYNDILRPSPTAAASIATPMAIVLWPPQPFGPSTASSATTFSNTYGSPSTAPNLPSRPEHPQQAAICREFNRRTCCCPKKVSIFAHLQQSRLWIEETTLSSSSRKYLSCNLPREMP